MIEVSLIELSELGDTQRMDAEYYLQKHLELERAVLKIESMKPWKKIDGEFITGPFGSEFVVERYVEESTYRYVRGKDVKNFFLLNDDNMYIPEKDFRRLEKYALQKKDILISVVGTIGNVSIVEDDSLPAIFSCKSTVFRSTSINPYYLIAYLNSKYGRLLLERRIRGHIQKGLNIDDLKSTPIFVPNKTEEKEIAAIVAKAKEHLDSCRLLYLKSESKLLEELQFSDFVPKYDQAFITDISRTVEVPRIDAEYFQPIYDKLLKKIEEKDNKRLGKIAERLTDKVTPDPNLQYKYIEISDIETDIGSVSFTIRNGKELPPNARIAINGGELIISKVRPTRGAISIIPEDMNRNVVCSKAFSVFNVGSPLREYLYIILRSVVGRLQMEKPTTGTSYPTIDDRDIERLKIPLLPSEIQNEISLMITKCHEEKKKANILLEKAKKEVEDKIKLSFST